MKRIIHRSSCLILALLITLSLSVGLTATAADDSTITGCGYTKSSDVEYLQVGDYVANWGYRNETCTFLSPMANEFYTEGYTFSELVKLAGGSGQDDAPESELYAALQKLMVDNHTHITTYDETKYQYMYTDCQGNDTSMLVSFYSGELTNSAWPGANEPLIWNREHTWPNSKCLNRGKAEDSADIIMLRPTLKSENGSRGNKSYGLSSGYYTPNEDVRGDCARIFLYVYVRWGNTEGNASKFNTKYNSAWGTMGVMENLEVLLQWMEEDPVDTWEMGRNDAAESITGTRNVFVDYPELAWLMFGQEVPEDLVTPSGYAANQCSHNYTSVVTAPTCTESGYTTHTCTLCGDSYVDSTTEATGHSYTSEVTKEATAAEYGEITYTCSCGDSYTEQIAKLAPEITENATGTVWSNGSDENLTFHSNAALEDFVKVLLNGEVLDPENYTVREGSTIVELKSSYLETLSDGEYTLSIVSTSGSADATFCVESQSNAPAVIIVCIIAAVCICGVVLLLVIKKKK